jgi:hypothetical protein
MTKVITTANFKLIFSGKGEFMTTILSHTEMSTCFLRQNLPETYHYKSILHVPLKKPQQELKKNETSIQT